MQKIYYPEDRLPPARLIPMGLQHVVAMFGATVLAPVLMGFDPQTAIFFSGVGTLIFIAATRGKVPSYLGSSFAFIGPVLAVIPYDGDDQAIVLANDSEFGLAGTVWSTDTERATEVAREIRTGTVGVNDYQLDVNAPFGGVKASGIGRELGPEGLEEFFSLKSIYRVGTPS